MKIGLVLGAGGVVGGAYHAGALTALEHDVGWDPRRADVIVGTSAGSLVAGLLRRSVPASDLAAHTVGAPLSPDGLAIEDALQPEFDPITLRTFMRLPRVPHPRAVWSAVRRPLRFDAMRALMTHMPDGRQVLAPHLEFLGTEWPDSSLYICAVNRRSGQRAVFGRNGHPTDGLGAAVAASCAVPGYFAPVQVDGDWYIDGGIASPTNADTLRELELDLVVIVSPMTTIERLPRYSFERVARERATRQLHREVGVLERRGIETMVLEPGAEVLEHVTLDFMSDEHTREIVAASFLETGAQLNAEPRRAIVERLRKLKPDVAA
jgi:NTE family protein